MGFEIVVFWDPPGYARRSANSATIIPETAISRDAVVMRLGDVKSIDDFPTDFSPQPVSDSVDLQQTLRRLFPDSGHRKELLNLVGDDY